MCQHLCRPGDKHSSKSWDASELSRTGFAWVKDPEDDIFIVAASFFEVVWDVVDMTNYVGQLRRLEVSFFEPCGKIEQCKTSTLSEQLITDCDYWSWAHRWDSSKPGKPLGLHLRRIFLTKDRTPPPVVNAEITTNQWLISVREKTWRPATWKVSQMRLICKWRTGKKWWDAVQICLLSVVVNRPEIPAAGIVDDVVGKFS